MYPSFSLNAHTVLQNLILCMGNAPDHARRGWRLLFGSDNSVMYTYSYGRAGGFRTCQKNKQEQTLKSWELGAGMEGWSVMLRSKELQ